MLPDWPADTPFRHFWDGPDGLEEGSILWFLSSQGHWQGPTITDPFGYFKAEVARKVEMTETTETVWTMHTMYSNGWQQYRVERVRRDLDPLERMANV